MKINNFEVKVKVINNRMRYTLLSIHGVNSSMAFTQNLDRLKNNFNHIKISMPVTGQFSINDLNEIVKTIIEKHIKSHHLVILGHSLGGIQVAHNWDNRKVKKVIYVAPFNPSVYGTSRKILVNAFLKETALSSLIKKGLDKYMTNPSKLLDVALDKNKPYLDMFKKSLFNKNFINDLDEAYRSNNKDSLYIIGANDKIINPREFEKYLGTLKKELHIVKGGHNPFKDDMPLMHEIINDFIPKHKTFFKRSIFKK